MRKLLLALSALALVFTSACGDDPVSSTTVVGSYTLVSINGDPLPASFDGLVITSGSVVLNANGTFVFSEGATGAGTLVVNGTWTLSGSTITFHPTDAEEPGDETGTVSGNTITATIDGGTRVYNKQ